MRKTKEESEKTRNDILDAAAVLFSQKGFSRTTLEDVARAAHVTRGAIYWHFKNKSEIFDALHERLHSLFLTFVQTDMAADHPDPITQLETLCVRLLIDLESNPHKRQALALFLLHTNYAGDLAPYKDRHCMRRAECSALFTEYFEKAQAQGLLPAHADPALLTSAVNYYMKGILMDYLATPDSFTMSVQAPRLFRLLFQGLRNTE